MIHRTFAPRACRECGIAFTPRCGAQRVCLECREKARSCPATKSTGGVMAPDASEPREPRGGAAKGLPEEIRKPTRVIATRGPHRPATAGEIARARAESEVTSAVVGELVELVRDLAARVDVLEWDARKEGCTK